MELKLSFSSHQSKFFVVIGVLFTFVSSEMAIQLVSLLSFYANSKIGDGFYSDSFFTKQFL